MSRDKIARMVAALGDLVAVLRQADPADKAEVYRQLGIRLTYYPENTKCGPRLASTRIMGNGPCPRTDLNQSPMLTVAEDLRVA
jgi:site-specific DNA recombinase